MVSAPEMRTVATPAPPAPPAGPVPAAGGPTPMDIGAPHHVERWVRVIPVVALGLVLGTLDQSMVGVANQAIANEFGLSNVDVQAVANIYRVVLGITLPAAIWLCQRYGLRRIFLVSMVLYAVTSMLCGLSQSFDLLLIFRALQAVPGAICAIATIATMQKVLPPDKMGPGLLLMAMLALCAPGFAPVIGGYFVSDNHWRWTFFIVVPFAVLGLLGGMALLPPLPSTGAPPFDLLGFLCLTAGLTCLTVVVTKGTYWGWSSYPILILAAVGVDLLALFVIVERQTAHPLIQAQVFRSQPFTVALTMVGLFAVDLAAIAAFMPPYLQQVQGMTAFGSGLLLVPQAVVFVLSIPVAGILMKKLGIRWAIVLGATILGTATIALSYLLVVTVDWEILAVVMAVRAVGLGIALLPLFGGAVAGLPVELINSGTMLRTMTQRIGSGLMLAAVTALITIDKQAIAANSSDLLDPVQAPQQHQEQMMDPTSQLGLWQQSQKYTTAQVYSWVFLILGWVTVVVLVTLAFVAQWGQPPRTNRYVAQDGA